MYPAAKVAATKVISFQITGHAYPRYRCLWGTLGAPAGKFYAHRARLSLLQVPIGHIAVPSDLAALGVGWLRAHLQFVLQFNLPYRACRRGWSVKPNQKGHVLQRTPFHSAYIDGWCVKRFAKPLRKTPTKNPYEKPLRKSPTKISCENLLRKSLTKNPYENLLRKSPAKISCENLLRKSPYQKSPTKSTTKKRQTFVGLPLFALRRYISALEEASLPKRFCSRGSFSPEEVLLPRKFCSRGSSALEEVLLPRRFCCRVYLISMIASEMLIRKSPTCSYSAIRSM